MKYREWEPLYEEILRDFGFDRAKDEETARLASELMAAKMTSDENAVKQAIEAIIRGRRVFICGNAPCLERELMERRKEFERSTSPDRTSAILAADGATSVLLHHAIIPDIVCTDLDGTIPDIITANRLGSILVVHAHGDNMKMLKKVLPTLIENVLCTTQSQPLHNVYNFGGFTDGDRCVFLAKEFGARSIELFGFDFGDDQVTEQKKKKLQWAKRLISASL
jgi:uncharacterized Rossmann fold enzyme